MSEGKARVDTFVKISLQDAYRAIGALERRMNDLIKWFWSEFNRRTDAIASGAARIDWLDTGTRVSWTEVVSKAEELGLDTSNPVKFRLDFQRAYSASKD
jgi:hypothetical protein